jgi:hypothetical protein
VGAHAFTAAADPRSSGLRMLLGRAQHAAHHERPYDAHYCITTGWCNRPCEAIGFFRHLKAAITRVTGVRPQRSVVVGSDELGVDSREGLREHPREHRGQPDLCWLRESHDSAGKGVPVLLFFSREERRAHVHVQHADGEAKFWIDPNVELVANFSLKPKQVAEAQRLIEEHLNEIRSAWAKHFPSGSH